MRAVGRAAGALLLGCVLVVSCGDDDGGGGGDEGGNAGEDAEGGSPERGGTNGETGGRGNAGAAQGGEMGGGAEGGSGNEAGTVNPGTGGDQGETGGSGGVTETGGEGGVIEQGGAAQGGVGNEGGSAGSMLGGAAGEGAQGGADAGEGALGGSSGEAGSSTEGGAGGSAGNGGQGGSSGSSSACESGATIGTTAANLAIAIPDDGYDGSKASMLCQDVVVPCTGNVADLIVTVAITHAWIGDLTIKLFSPGATLITLLNRPGSDQADDGGTTSPGDSSNLADTSPIIFLDGNPADAEAMGSTLADGGVVCEDDAVCKYAPNPDTASGGTLETLDDTQLKGTWQLCVADSTVGDAGTLEQVMLALPQ